MTTARRSCFTDTSTSEFIAEPITRESRRGQDNGLGCLVLLGGQVADGQADHPRRPWAVELASRQQAKAKEDERQSARTYGRCGKGSVGQGKSGRQEFALATPAGNMSCLELPWRLYRLAEQQAFAHSAGTSALPTL